MKRSLAALLSATALALAEPSSADEGPSFPVSRIELEYASPHPDAPPLDRLSRLGVELGEVPGGYAAPGPDRPGVRRTLAELSTGTIFFFHPNAVGQLTSAVVAALNRRGLAGVYVAPSPTDIDLAQERDLRPAGQTALRLVVYTARVRELRTLASGDRIRPERRINHPDHVRLRRQSPLQPSGTGRGTDLLRRDWLEDYLFRLNRHPGRRVDAAVSASPDGEGADLDLLVNEIKPWYLYAQTANTGTKQTNKWRTRFGFTHYQLTDRDDILSVDYVNSGIDNAHALLGSYEAPWRDSQRLRLRGSLAWNKFEASDVGLANPDFSGEEWRAGGRAIWNIFQHRAFFLDLVGGLGWQYVKTENKSAAGATGEVHFALPSVGLRLERVTDTSSLLAAATLEGNWSSISGDDEDELSQLGRLDPDTSWLVTRWDAQASTYLEPILLRRWWKDPSTPWSSTLAHELWLASRGQYAFDYRLIPQQQMVAGGLLSVRGYPESLAVGDSVVIGRAEYRFHLPRALPPRQPLRIPWVGEFRAAPQQVYARPDWDLVFRAFVDAASVRSNNRVGFEDNYDLLSAGLGVELQIKRNIRLRMDVGQALKGVDTTDHSVDAGDRRYHFLFTVMY